MEENNEQKIGVKDRKDEMNPIFNQFIHKNEDYLNKEKKRIRIKSGIWQI